MQYEFPFQDELDKLNTLLSQNQFELLVPNIAVSSQQTSDIRLVYLMNDAVESFLVFKEAALTGTYLKEYEGELEARLDESEGRYVLAVYQGETVCTLFFQNLTLEGIPVRYRRFSGEDISAASMPSGRHFIACSI